MGMTIIYTTIHVHSRWRAIGHIDNDQMEVRNKDLEPPKKTTGF